MRILTLLFVSALLQACSSTPEYAKFPQSTLESSKNTGDGTAIAFQVSMPECDSATFRLAQKLSDGKYGKTYRFQFVTALIALAPNSVKGRAFPLNDPERLHATLIPAGRYVATRPTCRKSDIVYKTQNGTLASFFEFNVDPAKTNYIGAIKIQHIGRSLLMSAKDDRSNIQEEYSKRYFDKDVGPLEMSIAKNKIEMIAKVEEGKN